MSAALRIGEVLAHALTEAVGSREPARYAALFAPDATYAFPESPEPLKGREAIEQLATAFLTSFPDMSFEARRVVHDGNVVVIEATTSGTQTGPLVTPDGTVPPSGRTFSSDFVGVYELDADGLVVNSREYYDPSDFAAQLGLTG